MISFIIPAYNAGKTIGYLERILILTFILTGNIESITNQEGTSVDYEVIVVDDGSDDDLREKVKEFKSDERIKYFYKENTGVSDTRNYGVNQAMGEYIIFVDSDDWLEKNALSFLMAQESDVDLIFYGSSFHSVNGNVTLYSPNLCICHGFSEKRRT